MEIAVQSRTSASPGRPHHSNVLLEVTARRKAPPAVRIAPRAIKAGTADQLDYLVQQPTAQPATSAQAEHLHLLLRTVPLVLFVL